MEVKWNVHFSRISLFCTIPFFFTQYNLWIVLLWLMGISIDSFCLFSFFLQFFLALVLEDNERWFVYDSPFTSPGQSQAFQSHDGISIGQVATNTARNFISN